MFVRWFGRTRTSTVERRRKTQRIKNRTLGGHLYKKGKAKRAARTISPAIPGNVIEVLPYKAER
jgi:hypothetical protein